MLTQKQFEYLLDSHVHAVSSLLSYYTSDRAELEDWVQDVFVKVWEERDKIDPEHPGVKGYLLTMARNHALYKLRQQKRTPFFEHEIVDEIPDPGNSTGERLNVQDLSAAYKRALAQVPPRAKQAFRLSRDKGLTYNQVADRMGISPRTVETQVSHTLKILRVKLAEFRL